MLPKKMRVERPACDRDAARSGSSYGLLGALVLYYLRHATISRPVQLRRAVLDVQPVRHDGDVDRPRACCCVATVFVRNLYCRFLCPVGAALGHPVEPDRLPDQALVRVQDLQDLREDLRVGRDSGTEDRQERVRALRRLRAALPGSAEVPALDHPATKERQGVSPRP